MTGRGKLSRLLEEDWWSFILVDKLFLVSLTLKVVSKEVDEVGDRTNDG